MKRATVIQNEFSHEVHAYPGYDSDVGTFESLWCKMLDIVCTVPVDAIDWDMISIPIGPVSFAYGLPCY